MASRGLGFVVAALSSLGLTYCAPPDLTASPLANPPQYHNGSNDFDLRPVRCSTGPPERANTLELSGDFGLTPWRESVPDNTLIDARRAEFTLDNCGWEGPVNAGPATFTDCDNCVWYGGIINGLLPVKPDVPRVYCNSVAVNSFKNATNTVIDSVRADRVWDGVKFAPRDDSANTTFVLQNSYISRARDDCVEDDQLHNMVIRNTLFDGCFMGISVDPGRAGVDKPNREDTHRVILDGVLMRMWELKYQGELSVGHPFKVKLNSPSIEIHNTVFAFEKEIEKPSRWYLAMEDKVKACSNNFLLWMSDKPLPSMFQTPEVKACFTVATGKEARQMWNTRKKAWLAQCGG
jgi:hypothetical protein